VSTVQGDDPDSRGGDVTPPDTRTGRRRMAVLGALGLVVALVIGVLTATLARSDPPSASARTVIAVAADSAGGVASLSPLESASANVAVHAASNPTASGAKLGKIYTGPGPEIASIPGPAAEVIMDTSDHYLGTATDVTWSRDDTVGAYGVFNGTGSEITIGEPQLVTSGGVSFTVAAWVKLTSESGFATAVSQDGSVNSGFYLQYSKADNRWAFSRVPSDTAGSPGIRALSSAPPALNTWTHLVGVFDADNNQLRLYVDKQLQGTATDSTPFGSAGTLVVGRALFNGQKTDWFTGDIAHVSIYPDALGPAQVADIWPL
jgi:hypothetical protein